MAEFRTISDLFAEHFPGKVRKIPVDAGLGCPCRCAYCNNDSFSPRYADNRKSGISAQLEEGIRFSSSKGEVFGYLAYFQSHSNTYGETETLTALYEEALAYPGIVGLVIATRPDCISGSLMDWFERRFGKKAPEGHPFLLVEIGVESTRDATLAAIGRGHDYECARRTIIELDRRGIPVGAHLIIGLPGETDEDYLRHADLLSELPICSLKLHQLQIIKGTPLAKQYLANPASIPCFSAEGYAAVLKKMLPRIRKDIALDRFVSEAPKGMVLAPSWGLKPSEFSRLLR